MAIGKRNGDLSFDHDCQREWDRKERQWPGAIAVFLLFCYSATMKATVTINSRGVVTLPAKLRQALDLKADDQLIAETTPEGLLLRPAVTLPVEIYTAEREREFDEAEAELAKVLAPNRARARRTVRANKR